MRVAARVILGLAVAACTPASEPASPAVETHSDRQVSDLDPPASDVDPATSVVDTTRRNDPPPSRRAVALGTVDEILVRFHLKDEACEPIEQGFGIEARTCFVYGGYTRCRLDLLAHERVVFEATANCTSGGGAWLAGADVLRTAFEIEIGIEGLSPDGDDASLTMRDAVVHTQVVDEMAAVLGARSRVSVPAALEQQYAQLSSPYQRVEIGTSCGMGGSVPEENLAMQELVAAGREDLLRELLRGTNAGGRIYGYIGLRLLGRNERADDLAFRRLRERDAAVWTCGGCVSEWERVKEIDLDTFHRISPAELERKRQSFSR